MCELKGHFLSIPVRFRDDSMRALEDGLNDRTPLEYVLTPLRKNLTHHGVSVNTQTEIGALFGRSVRSLRRYPPPSPEWANNFMDFKNFVDYLGKKMTCRLEGASPPDSKETWILAPERDSFFKFNAIVGGDGDTVSPLGLNLAPVVRSACCEGNTCLFDAVRWFFLAAASMVLIDRYVLNNLNHLVEFVRKVLGKAQNVSEILVFGAVLPREKKAWDVETLKKKTGSLGQLITGQENPVSLTMKFVSDQDFFAGRQHCRYLILEGSARRFLQTDLGVKGLLAGRETDTSVSLVLQEKGILDFVDKLERHTGPECLSVQYVSGK